MRYIGYLKRLKDETPKEFRARAKKHKGYLQIIFGELTTTIKLEFEKDQAHFWVGK